ncbi:hypothetical protein [Roseovarius pelagicus]|uniref:Uncharacterized protein n=1 Tax=Roseovarius pelagicus TaxID=2980108 RepID=A0ABY6DHP5_9RHOB|nr:hypothetical protein [Roseovarius pelagicus]UXX85065.1 hypothetical protein N7U68_10660 [Roseovarius pelagicus]
MRCHMECAARMPVFLAPAFGTGVGPRGAGVTRECARAGTIET